MIGIADIMAFATVYNSGISGIIFNSLKTKIALSDLLGKKLVNTPNNIIKKSNFDQ